MILEIIVHSHEATEPVNLLYIKWTPWYAEPGFSFGIHPAIQYDGHCAPGGRESHLPGSGPGCEHASSGSGIVRPAWWPCGHNDRPEYPARTARQPGLVGPAANHPGSAGQHCGGT